MRLPIRLKHLPIPITDDQLRAVRKRAVERRDSRLVAICDIALGVKKVAGDPTENRRRAKAICYAAWRRLR